MNTVVAVVGLGYVGLPLAVAFSKIFSTIGFDVSEEKIKLLQVGQLPSDEIDSSKLKSADQLKFTNDPKDLGCADYILVAVPTLVSTSHQPDFTPLVFASQLIGTHMKSGAIVVYESTVYPGVTEDICIPAIEKASKKKWKKDFHVGYSPERVNPGDSCHSLKDISKLVSGDDEQTLKKIASLYSEIIESGIHEVSSIKVAEAAKVIENTQRDLLIALMNEISIISHLVGIDTQEVISAAATKWNFIPMKPGLVGGHCIGVVPYYLTYMAELHGYHPEVISAGRHLNESMGRFIADQLVKELIKADKKVNHASVTILGLSFKENIRDISNSKIVDLINQLRSFNIDVHIHDPYANPLDARERYGIHLTSWEELPKSDAIVLSVAHAFYIDLPLESISALLNTNGCVIDIPGVLDQDFMKSMGHSIWRL